MPFFVEFDATDHSFRGFSQFDSVGAAVLAQSARSALLQGVQSRWMGLSSFELFDEQQWDQYHLRHVKLRADEPVRARHPHGGSTA